MQNDKTISPIIDFAMQLESARQSFGQTDKLNSARIQQWIGFMEAKENLLTLLQKRLPQVCEISEFWRSVQYLSGPRLVKWLRSAVAEIELKRRCHQCTAKIEWPRKFCKECAKERKTAAVAQARERARVKQALRKCECGARLDPRRRFCDSCARSRRRESIRKSKCNS